MDNIIVPGVLATFRENRLILFSTVVILLPSASRTVKVGKTASYTRPDGWSRSRHGCGISPLLTCRHLSLLPGRALTAPTKKNAPSHRPSNLRHSKGGPWKGLSTRTRISSCAVHTLLYEFPQALYGMTDDLGRIPKGMIDLTLVGLTVPCHCLR